MPIPPRVSVVTLRSTDLARSTAFYRALGWELSSASTPAMSLFRTAGGVLLLAGDDLLAELGGDEVAAALRGEPTAAAILSIHVASDAEVDEAVDAVEAAAAAGGVVVKRAGPTPLGGRYAFFADPDGHLWEVIHHPRYQLGGDGRPEIPAAPGATAAPERTPERRFGWWDMWASPDEDPREAGGPYAGERATLVRYLRDRRLTLEMKCQGLDAEAMARRSVPPSNLSLLGLVRHLADTERYWFRQVVAGEDAPARFPAGSDFDQAVADPAVVAEAWAAWRDEVAFAERVVAQAPDLDLAGTGDSGRQPMPLREVLVHMIEEYARHNGHADLIRERIDGRIGQ